MGSGEEERWGEEEEDEREGGERSHWRLVGLEMEGGGDGGDGDLRDKVRQGGGGICWNELAMEFDMFPKAYLTSLT